LFFDPQVSADFNSRQEGRAAAARIFSVLEGPTDGSDAEVSSDDDDGTPLNGAIEFQECEFHYPTRPNNAIFYKSVEHNGLTLAVAPKESLGLVGRSGSGKSSILQLVLRFYDISGGTVLMDENRKLEELNVTRLRQQIGYVGQQPTLFKGTVRENILLGKPDATEDEIIAAAKAAHAHDFVTDLSEGYDTEIGAGGGHLSGGQKQRIAIARAIVRNPQILILDEATAALDNESEKLVQAALDDLQEKQPRTTLVVAHRLLTVKDCDKIAFLGDGCVQEIGTHDKLCEKQGNYCKLWRMQGAEEELKKTQSVRGSF
jgi:ATP-binding cassette subfamily B (MDR/TAP) protein 1